jgi:hypothetical protein
MCSLVTDLLVVVRFAVNENVAAIKQQKMRSQKAPWTAELRVWRQDCIEVK